MKIGITGGNGYVGSHLVKKLQEKGHEVCIYDLPNDICDKEQFRQWVKDNNPEIVYHLATMAEINWCDENPVEANKVNVFGTAVIAEVCAEFMILLNYISTCCAYGNQEVLPINENTLPNPSEIYACNKLAGEYIVKGLGISTGMKYNILRLATMFGPSVQENEKRPDMAIPIFFDKAIKGETFEIHGNGLQTRTYTFVEDVVDALVLVTEKGITGETLTLTNTEEISVLDIANKVKEFIPEASWTFGPDRKGQIKREVFDNSKAINLLGWNPKINFNEGMKRYFEWLSK